MSSEELKAAAAAEAELAAADESSKPKAAEEKAKKPRRKENKKRIRRVGKSEPRKMLKEDDSKAEPKADAVVGEDGPLEIRRVVSKHDEKWNDMFGKLLAFKKEHNHTLVPQCYKDDQKLGRWVHYQRVEYWMYQQTGSGKITPDRINRLEAMGFEWDPQKAQWNMMYDKLLKYKEEAGHCKVPKGYQKDPELANWVRNQRLEQANMKKGKKTRMTEERFEKLDSLDFKWSTSIAKKGSSPKKAPKESGTKGSGATTSDAKATEAPTEPAVASNTVEV